MKEEKIGRYRKTEKSMLQNESKYKAKQDKT